MRRALQLAGNGEGRVSPNPMVGAVIVARGRIIGEGFHSYFGGPHAEVNAINSVKEEDKSLLKESTLYVTLEPCAHHGKTPPCADLIVKTGIPTVVIGSPDPNPLVAGKGLKILEKAGIKTYVGILREQTDNLNKKFLKAQQTDRPWILLKWAQSSDGFMADMDENGQLIPYKFSTDITSVWMHRERAGVDAILIGGNTDKIDHPRLNVRFWGGNSPVKYVAHHTEPLESMFMKMKKDGVSSVMVEGGQKVLNSLIKNNLFDEVRIEISPVELGKGLKSPTIPHELRLADSFLSDGNVIMIYRR